MRQSQRQGSAQATNYRPYFEGDGVDSPGEQFWNSLTAGDEDQELFLQLKRFLAFAQAVGPGEFGQRRLGFRLPDASPKRALNCR